MTLSARGITKSRGGRTVLHSVTVDIKPSELTVITGPSGSGKSTLLNALATVEPPDEGIIDIDGLRFVYPSSGKTVPRPWPGVTVVFQQLALWPHLSLRRNLTLPLDASGARNYGKRLQATIDALNLTQFVDRWPAEVSVGERQRVAIARALLLEPKYLLLDEILSAQDIEHIERIGNILRDLLARGVGIALVTHMVGVGRRWADRFMFLENGTVVEAGAVAVLSDPRTTRLAEFIALHEAVRR